MNAIPMLLYCPKCHTQHIDKDDETGKWASERLHRTHLCLNIECGELFRPSNLHTVGVLSLPDPNQLPMRLVHLPEMYETLDVRFLAYECERIAQEHGWWMREDRNMGELLMLVTTEIAEAFEEVRSGHELDLIYHTHNGFDQEYVSEEPTEGKPEGFLVEIADVVIRVLDFVEHYGLTDKLMYALRLKLRYNETRPYRHGGKTA